MVQGPAHSTLCVWVYWYAVVTMTMQVRHVKTVSFTVDLAVKNIWTEMCRWITRLVRDLYIRRPILLAEVGELNGEIASKVTMLLRHRWEHTNFHVDEWSRTSARYFFWQNQTSSRSSHLLSPCGHVTSQPRTWLSSTRSLCPVGYLKAEQ